MSYRLGCITFLINFFYQYCFESLKNIVSLFFGRVHQDSCFGYIRFEKPFRHPKEFAHCKVGRCSHKTTLTSDTICKFRDFHFFYLSLFFLIILLFFIKDNFNYTYIFILSIILKNIYVFYNELEYLFNKFLLERYLFGYSFDKTKIINNYKDMYKDYQHIIKCNKKYIKECDFLRKMFDRS